MIDKKRIGQALAVAFMLQVCGHVYPIGFVEKQRVIQLLDQKMRIDGIPGMSLALVEGGEISWEYSLGMADVEYGIRANVDTSYRSASLVKPITATAIMQLHATGELDLDAPVWKYCKDFPEKNHVVSSRGLLTHTAGIRSYSMPWSRFEAELFSAERYKSVTDAIRIFADDPLLHKPGSAFKYTSYGYNLLGCVIEGITGQSYENYLKENIFAPAGMQQTVVDKAEIIVTDRAGLYRRGKKGALVNERYVDLTNKIPAAGLLTTASDMARFTIAYMDGALISNELAFMTYQPVTLTDGATSTYAMGWDLKKVPLGGIGNQMYHAGSTPGVSGMMYVFPDNKNALIFFANLYGVDGKEELAQEIAAIAGLVESSEQSIITSSSD